GSRALPGRWSPRYRLQCRRAGYPAPGHHTQERAVCRIRRRREDMGHNREPSADSQDERRRSLRLADTDSPAHRRRLAKPRSRPTPAVQPSPRLNGLGWALTLMSPTMLEERIAGEVQILGMLDPADITALSESLKACCRYQPRDQARRCFKPPVMRGKEAGLPVRRNHSQLARRASPAHSG